MLQLLVPWLLLGSPLSCVVGWSRWLLLLLLRPCSLRVLGCASLRTATTEHLSGARCVLPGRCSPSMSSGLTGTLVLRAACAIFRCMVSQACGAVNPVYSSRPLNRSCLSRAWVQAWCWDVSPDLSCGTTTREPSPSSSTLSCSCLRSIVVCLACQRTGRGVHVVRGVQGSTCVKVREHHSCCTFDSRPPLSLRHQSGCSFRGWLLQCLPLKTHFHVSEKESALGARSTTIHAA